MENPSTSWLEKSKASLVYLEKVPKKRRGKQKDDLLNVVRRQGGGRAAFKDLKYDVVKPLYELWCGYFGSVLEEMRGNLDTRIMKLDYHGCILRVADANNPSMIGLHGIVVHESRHTFQLIDRKNKLIVIPKEGSTFQFVFKSKVYTIFGDAMKQKSYLRGKKLKHRATLPFLLK